jgi:hypothetical protein
MGMFSKVNARTKMQTVMLRKHIQMEVNTRAIGKKINIMVKAKRPGPKEIVSKETISTERKLGKEIIDGLTDQPIMDNTQITKCKGKE